MTEMSSGPAAGAGQRTEVNPTSFRELPFDPGALDKRVGKVGCLCGDAEVITETHEGRVVCNFRREQIVGRRSTTHPRREHEDTTVHHLVEQRFARHPTVPGLECVRQNVDVHAHAAMVTSSSEST